MVMGSLRQEAEVAVVGAGPGGYVAALRAADLGKEVVLIEERERPGGVCLIEGCIPSKTLIGAVELADTLRHAEQMGLSASGLKIDPQALRAFTDQVVAKTSRGVSSLLKGRGIDVIHGRARLTGKRALAVEGGEVGGIDFRHCILATGSRFNELPGAYEAPVWSSADALQLPSIPERLLVVGGGYVGLELGLVYAGLGSQVTVVDFSPRLLMGADPDLVEVMVGSIERRLSAILVDSKVMDVRREAKGFTVTIEHEGETQSHPFDQILAAVGRRPNTENLGLETVGIEVDAQGRIPVDEGMRTSQAGIYAIGDIAPGPMLAHKASREGKVAAEVIAGRPAAFDNRAIPAAVFTDPEIAWVGITEREAQEREIPVHVGRFPLRALGRARAIGRTAGLTKILSDPETGAILGIGLVGPQASELISEGALAIEMGATLEDLMVTIHPHPTLSESILEAAEIAAGVAVHMPRTKKS